LPPRAGGKILGVLALFLVVVWYALYREDGYTQLFYFPAQENKTTCPLGELEKKVVQLIANYTREQPLFLQLKDYFWVKTPSLYELPYGTKGSEDVLLRLLSITHYSLPESIQRLKCRRCAVVGNGHRLRNSSMGETIDAYDIVIRYVPMSHPSPLPPLPPHPRVPSPRLNNAPVLSPTQKPTTGLLAITLALHLCDLVHIAGFGYPDLANKKQTIHYYEQITLKSMAASEHNVSHEAMAIKRMLELGLLKNLTYF
ncbi:SIA4C sialyltransferase, partial [Columbina picui]|nr:SIA4C sialyltransferase [Columbina picui]